MFLTTCFLNEDWTGCSLLVQNIKKNNNSEVLYYKIKLKIEFSFPSYRKLLNIFDFRCQQTLTP